MLHVKTWKNEKKRISQWENTLETYASPFIGCARKATPKKV
jgi:hypothetical protein